MLKAKSILFVCYGNVCRSPMAEGMAKKSMNEDIRIESAGLSPVLPGAADEAIRIMKDNYDVDISGHVPRNIIETPFRKFDLIIVLDTHVHKMMKQLAPDLTAKLMLWDIPDPYGRDAAVYRQVAATLWAKIQKHLL